MYIKTSCLYLLMVVFSLFFTQPVYSFQKIDKDSLKYYENKVINAKHKDDLIEAFGFFVKTKDQFLKESNYKDAIFTLHQIARVQNQLGFFYDSEASTIEALKLLDAFPKMKNATPNRIVIYNHLGLIYRNLLDYDKAINYYQKALDIVQTDIQKKHLKNNKAYALLRSGKLDLALKEYQALITVVATEEDSPDKARVLNNYAIVKGKLNQPDAISYFNQALEMRENLDRKTEIIGSHIDLSNYYNDSGSLVKAKQHAITAYNLAQGSKNSNIISETLDLVIGLKTDAEVLLYKHISDSIEVANLLTDGKYTSKKYDLGQLEKQASANLLQAEKEKYLKLIYAYSAALILILAFVGFFITRQRHKRDKQLEIYNTELRISKKVHDEVANDVYHLMNKFQQSTTHPDSILDDLESVYEKTRDISREYHDINVTENYQELLKDFISNYQSPETNILIKGVSKINWEGVSETKKITIYRVIQELMTNMKKHSSATIVILDFKKQGRKIHVQYTDNGVGSNLKKQNGLLNTENRINTINGSITFKSQINQGFSALIIV